MASGSLTIRRLPHAQIHAWARACLEAVGVNAADAERVAGALVQTCGESTRRRGAPDHYLARLQAAR
jgi:hypothetical protein